MFLPLEDRALSLENIERFQKRPSENPYLKMGD